MKTRFFLFSTVLLLCCLQAVRPQSRIERLLPILLDSDGIKVTEFIDNKIEGSNRTANYVLVLQSTPIGELPRGLKDSLVAAFEHEYFMASESDRYYRRGKAGDTLSYALVYNGAYESESGHNVTAGDYGIMGLKVSAAANLDIKGGNLLFDFYMEGRPQHRVQLRDSYAGQSQSAEVDMLAALTAVFNEIADNGAVSRSTICFDGSKNTSGYCLFQSAKYKQSRSKGTRLEVPQSLAEEAYTEMANLMNGATFTDQAYSFMQEGNGMNIVFAEDFRGDAFLLYRAADGRVIIFHKEPQEEDYGNAVPQNWYSEDYVEY